MDWRKRRIIDNLYGPAGTLLVHVLLVVALFKFVHFKSRDVEREVEAVVRQVEEPPELEEVQQELEQIEDIPTVVDAVAPPDVSVDQQPPQVDAVRAPGAEGMDLSDFDVVASVSPLSFKGLYASRSAAGRAGALSKYAGGLDEQTEVAVLKALNWLNTHQYPDGSWGPSYRAAMTGLALLTFFAHGESTGSPEYGTAIRKGLQYLLKRQQDGVFVGGGPVDFWSLPTKYADQVRVYEHAVATYAISEAYNITRIPYLRPAMEAGVQVLLDGQHEAGSWDYGYKQGPEAHVDVSLAGWSLQALKAAASAGAENPGLKAAIEAGVRGLKLQFRKSGRFQYSTRDVKHAEDTVMTAVAVLCLQITGHALDDEAKAGMTILQNASFSWSPGDRPGQDRRDMRDWPWYGWYYLTQARFHQGGRTWASWNRQFAPVLCRMQNEDGSWCPAPKSAEAMFGPVYCTTLATLQLEVYYRFLPTYQPIEIDEGPGLEELEGDEDIVITLG